MPRHEPPLPPPPARSTPAAALSSWSANIGKLLDVVEKTCQQIQKESMIHRVQLGAAPVGGAAA